MSDQINLPEESASDLRERPRVSIQRIVRFMLRGGPCSGLALDLSSKGARIRVAQRGLSDHASVGVEVGESMEISFELGSGKDEVTLEAEVCRITEDGFAVQFTEPDSEEASTLGKVSAP